MKAFMYFIYFNYLYNNYYDVRGYGVCISTHVFARVHKNYTLQVL